MRDIKGLVKIARLQSIRERAVRKLREAEIEAKYRSETVHHEDVRERVGKIIETAQMLYA